MKLKKWIVDNLSKSFDPLIEIWEIDFEEAYERERKLLRAHKDIKIEKKEREQKKSKKGRRRKKKEFHPDKKWKKVYNPYYGRQETTCYICGVNVPAHTSRLCPKCEKD